MLPHDRESYRQQMGHVWLGFAEDQTQIMLDASGFENIKVVPLPTGVQARGPGLFVATGRKKGAAK
jgi:ArsR family transcriptional regulator